MRDPISVIMCVVGVVGCVIGVATFISAQVTRAKEDGVLMAKVDYLVQGLDELKKDTNLKSSATNQLLTEHTKEITDIKSRLKTLEREVFHGGC